MSHAHTRQQNDPSGHGQPVLVEVLHDFLVRREHGVKKYGHELKAGNGRNPLQDLYQELLDAVMYVKQELMEQDQRKRFITRRAAAVLQASLSRWYRDLTGFYLDKGDGFLDDGVSPNEIKELFKEFEAAELEIPEPSEG